MKAIRCSDCGKIIGYAVNNNDNNFLCIICAEKRLKNKNKTPGGLKTASGFITIKNNSSLAFRDFGKKPKSVLNRFIIELYINNAISTEKCTFFSRDGVAYKVKESEYLIEFLLPNGDFEYYLIRDGNIIDHIIIKR